MDAPAPDRQRLLRALQRELEALERSGARWLSIAPHPGLAEALRRASDDRQAAAAQDIPAASLPGAAGAGASAAQADSTAPAVPAAQEPLAALGAQYRDCRACKLCDTRTQVVFGVGSDQPRLMFIGEGPGADEDAQGEPFVGRAGQLLTGLIRAAGLVRDDVYITNVVKCRPPGNRNPEPDEVASCRPILQRQIERLDPALIVVLGNVPLKTLRPEAGGITRERGRPFTYQRWPVLPTFHPSYLLRNPAAMDACWQDFRKALQMAYPQA